MNNLEKLANYKLEVAPLGDAEGGGFQASYPQLGRTAVGYGETQGEALQDLMAVAKLLSESLDEEGEELPTAQASADWQDYSGRVTLRVSKSLHYRLEKLSHAEGISLNSLLSDMLQSGATALESGFTFGAVAQKTHARVSA